MSREMKDSGVEWIGEIPKDWKIVKNKNCFELEKNIVGSSFEDYQLLSLTKKGIVKKDFNDVSGKIPDSYSTYQSVRKNQLVLCLFDLDCSAVFSGLSKFDGMISPAYKVYNCKSNIYEDFARYWFDFCFDGRKYKNFSKSLRYVVNAEDFGSIEIVLPTILEQQKIANFLDEKVEEIDRLIDNAKKSIEEYKKYKQSVITKAVTKGLDPNVEMKDSRIECVGYIPKNWKVVRNAILFKENIRTCDENDIPLSLSQVDGVVPTKDMKEKALKTSTYDNWKKVLVGDLVLNRFKAHLGVLFESKLEGMVSFHYGVYEPQIKLKTKYYEYLFHSECYKMIYAGMSNGMVIGLQNLSNANFYTVRSLYPPIKEQIEIVEYLDLKCIGIDNLISKKQQLISELESYKKSLIYEYVTGKKEVL